MCNRHVKFTASKPNAQPSLSNLYILVLHFSKLNYSAFCLFRPQILKSSFSHIPHLIVLIVNLGEHKAQCLVTISTTSNHPSLSHPFSSLLQQLNQSPFHSCPPPKTPLKPRLKTLQWLPVLLPYMARWGLCDLPPCWPLLSSSQPDQTLYCSSMIRFPCLQISTQMSVKIGLPRSHINSTVLSHLFLKQHLCPLLYLFFLVCTPTRNNMYLLLVV